MSSAIITHRESYAYMAWRRNPQRDPRFRLQSEDEAMDQAERLARQRPGSTYIVMREIARVTISNSVPTANSPGRSVEPGGIPLPSSGSKGGDVC